MGKPLAVITALVYTIASAVLPAHAGSGVQEGSAKGSAVGQQLLSTYGSKSAFEQRFAAPLTSSKTKMLPLLSDYYRCPDNSKVFTSAAECSASCSSPCERGFNAQIQAPSTDVFLELVIHPTGSGDIDYLIVRQDTDFDGRLDSAYTFSLAISGVCANGFISCEPGTWKNCRYFRWVASNDLKVSAEEVPYISTYLGGCYCINASCGQGSQLVWNNVGQILEHLGGGAVGAVQQIDPRLSVTAVEVKPFELTIRYYGQKVPEMAQRYAQSSQEALYFSGEQNPQQYYKAPALLDAATQQQVQDQARLPESMYSLLSNSSATKSSPFEMRTCTVTRDFMIENESKVIGFDVQVYVGCCAKGDPEYCYAASVADGKCRLYLPGGDEIDCSVCPTWIYNRLKDLTMAIYYGGDCVPYTDPYTGRTGCFTPSGQPLIFEDWRMVEGWNYAPPYCYSCRENRYQRSLYRFDAYFDNKNSCAAVSRRDGLLFCLKEWPVLQKQDSCSTLDVTGCKLYEEQICSPSGSCIYTYKNFNPTGLKPLPECTRRGSDKSGVLWTVCVDGSQMTYSSTAGFGGVLDSGTDVWWRIKRTYYCALGGQYELSGAQQRMASLQETTSYSSSSGVLTWTDFLPGTSTRIAGQAQIPGFGDDYGDCEMVCEVAEGAPETQAGAYGHQGYYLTNTQGTKREFRPCRAEGGSWVCPYDPSKETKLKDCGCLNSFNEAIASMQLLRDASKDIICSTTSPN